VDRSEEVSKIQWLNERFSTCFLPYESSVAVRIDFPVFRKLFFLVRIINTVYIAFPTFRKYCCSYDTWFRVQQDDTDAINRLTTAVTAFDPTPGRMGFVVDKVAI
jgi:hypothetical protein